MAEERLGLGGEAEIAAEVGEEERPDAEAVTGEEELAPLARSQTAKREVAVQARRGSSAPHSS